MSSSPGVPTRWPGLHERAAQWFRTNGHVDEAITHLRAAGLRSQASELVQANWLTFVDAGRGPTVVAWLQSLGRNSGAFDPAEAVTAAWMAAWFGDEAALARHVQSLEQHADHGPLPDGSHSVESALAMIAGMLGYGGPLAMRRAAERAVELETDGLSPFYAVAHVGLGHAAYVSGELNLAAEMLDRATSCEAAPTLVRVFGLAVQSLAEGELGRHERSRELAERAMEIVDARRDAPAPPSGAGLRGSGSGAGVDGQGE